MDNQNNVTSENTVVQDTNVVEQSVTQTEEVGYTSLVGVNAEVLGELRKDKIGKPYLVLEIAVLFAVVLIALPIVNNMLNDTESALYKLLYGNPATIVNKKPTTVANEWVDGSVLQPLTTEIPIMVDNIVMGDFKLSKGKVECVMYSYNGLLNLDDEEYYLEIYSNSKEIHSYYKLTGTFDFQKKNVVLERPDANFNTDLKYFGKIVKMDENSYPEVTMTTDVNGVGQMTCKKGLNSYTYTFRNQYLVKIDNYEKYVLADMEAQSYMNTLANYRKKAGLLPGLAMVEEVEDGFVYQASVDLEAPGFVLPTGLGDSNYYKLDTKAQLIRYAMIGKGFDCV